MRILIFLIGSCFIYHQTIGMELIAELSTEQKNSQKIKSLNAARDIASLQEKSEWSNYPLSSRVMVQIIQQQRLGYEIEPEQEEIECIKNIKKNDSDQYQLLHLEMYTLLKAMENKEDLQSFRCFYNYRNAAQENHKKIEWLEAQIPWYEKYTDQKIIKGNCFDSIMPIIIFGLVLESIVLLITGVSSVRCWEEK